MNRPSVPLRRRVSLRLGDHSYDAPGGYFITTCVYNRRTIFEGDIIEAIAAAWQGIPRQFPGVDLDAFVIMPNHVHGIIIITDRAQTADSRGMVVEPRGAVPEPPLQVTQPVTNRASERRRMLLPSALAFFKTVSGKRINLLRGTPGLPVWQRGYHEHVIRSEAELVRIRQYINDNPSRWDEDPENPNSAARDNRRGGSGTAPRRVMPPSWSG